jgi:hypothetical protein
MEVEVDAIDDLVPVLTGPALDLQVPDFNEKFA